ncbi:MAG: hypothetical protein V1894_00450 [Chloroflexota bacterium]
MRFSYDSDSGFGITDPDVVRLNDGTYLMFLSFGINIIKATSLSSSGTFTYDPAFGWNQGGVPGSYNFACAVRTFTCYQNGIHVAIYDEKSGRLNYEGIALSPPPFGIIADPSVIQVDDRYLMFYKYATSPQIPPSEHEIYLATSADGINWSPHTQNRFIGRGSVPGAVYHNGVIYVYYCGLVPKATGKPNGDMGLAVSWDKGETFAFSVITIEGKTPAGAVDPSAIVVDTIEVNN